MELTNSYIKQQSVTKEEYLSYREQKAKEFMKIVQEGLGKNMTHKEMVRIEFGFKKGMDTITKGGQYIAEEVIKSEHIRQPVSL